MSAISSVLVLYLMLFGTSTSRGQETKPASISGTLVDRAPVGDAEIDLQSLADEHCAKLFASRTRNAKAAQELKSCAHDLAPTHTNSDGRYEFSGLAPGWYAIHLLWNIAQKPSHPKIFQQGEWSVMVPGYKDVTGKYDTFAQGKPFFLSGKSDVVKDFSLSSQQR